TENTRNTQIAEKPIKEGTDEGKGGGNKGTRRKRKKAGKGGEGYRRYVYRVLKQVHPELGISFQAMTILNNLMTDMFERLADEATRLKTYTGRVTLSSREIQGAVKLVLPGELGRHAIAEGAKAVTNYMSSEDARQ
ncbi:late histone H2B.L4-like, partial [Neltuma alba]|uniref:late histone H2B.L4-like n=1 Tax=Neltuma alba TaxID=207710 RepID=UPI0010A529ED